jgi:hypothetical protein
MADRTAIPGAPEGFYAPGNLTPEELAAFMRRLRFGGSSLTNATIDPLGQRTDTGPTPEGQALEQTPEAVSAMLEFAKQVAPSINGSYTANVMKKLGRGEGPPAPTGAAEYEMLHPSAGPAAEDLPSDVLARKQFMDTEAAKQRGAESAAGVEETGAKAALHKAQATALGADTKSHAPEMRAIADIIQHGKDSLDPSTIRALGHRAEELSGVTPAAAETAQKEEVAATAATEVAGAMKREGERKSSLWGKMADLLPLNPNEDQQIIAQRGFRPGEAPVAGAPGPIPPNSAAQVGPPPIGNFNPMPGQGGPPVTERNMAPDPKDPNIKWFNGRPYRKLPTGGWQLIQQGGFGAGMRPE